MYHLDMRVVRSSAHRAAVRETARAKAFKGRQGAQLTSAAPLPHKGAYRGCYATEMPKDLQGFAFAS